MTFANKDVKIRVFARAMNGFLYVSIKPEIEQLTY